MDAELEKAQAQAMEALLQQCVAAPSDGQVVSGTRSSPCASIGAAAGAWSRVEAA